MKNTLIILSLAVLPTLAQAEEALDRNVDVVTVSEAKPAQPERNGQELLLTTDTKKESSSSKAEKDPSKQDK